MEYLDSPLEYSSEWFDLTGKAQEIDKVLYEGNLPAQEAEVLKASYDTLIETRNTYKPQFEDERKNVLLSDIKDLTDKDIHMTFNYIPTIYKTFVSPKDELAYNEHTNGRVTPEEKKELEAQGYDVCIVRLSYNSMGSINISDSFDELVSTSTEGHEAGHTLLQGSPLQWNYWNDESRTICDTACDVIGELRLRHYVEKYHDSQPEIVAKMEKQISYSENFGKIINDAKEEIEPLLAAGDIDGADAVVQKYTDMTDDVLGKHREINRCTIALFSMYSGNSQVNDALHKLVNEGGINGMVEDIWEVTTIDELLEVAYGTPQDGPETEPVIQPLDEPDTEPFITPYDGPEVYAL